MYYTKTTKTNCVPDHFYNSYEDDDREDYFEQFFGEYVRNLFNELAYYMVIKIKLQNGTVVLSDKYNLYNPKTIIKFKLVIDKNYINNVCCLGRVHTLEFLKSSYLFPEFPEYTDNTLIHASNNGHISVLEWWKNSGLPLKYNNDAINYASLSGHVAVLEWWKNSGLPLQYDDLAVHGASENGHINVLEWWKNSCLKLIYGNILTYPSHSDRDLVAVLEWWKNSGLEIIYTTCEMDYAHKPHVLEWWKNSGLELKYSKEALDWASGHGQVAVLEWWKNSGLELKYSEEALNTASGYGKVAVLEWWKNSGLL